MTEIDDAMAPFSERGKKPMLKNLVLTVIIGCIMLPASSTRSDAQQLDPEQHDFVFRDLAPASGS
jgi:hypothetical protein